MKTLQENNCLESKRLFFLIFFVMVYGGFYFASTRIDKRIYRKPNILSEGMNKLLKFT